MTYGPQTDLSSMYNSQDSARTHLLQSPTVQQLQQSKNANATIFHFCFFNY